MVTNNSVTFLYERETWVLYTMYRERVCVCERVCLGGWVESGTEWSRSLVRSMHDGAQ